MKNYHTHRAAVYLMLMQDNKILLSRRANTGYKDGMYGMVSGHVEKAEGCLSALIREAKEEIGITINKNDLEVAHVLHRNCEDDLEYVDVFIKTSNYKGDIKNCEPEKCDKLEWFSLDNLPNEIVEYLPEVFNHIKNNRFYSEQGWSE